MKSFGAHVRRRREMLRARDPAYSLRRVAWRIGVEPSYLSKVERQLEAPPSEPRIRSLAAELDQDPDVLLALAGKVAKDLQQAICDRPELLARLIRLLETQPDEALRRIARQFSSGKSSKESP